MFEHIFMQREKSNALDASKVFETEVKNQLNRKIKVVALDRGADYYSR